MVAPHGARPPYGGFEVTGTVNQTDREWEQRSIRNATAVVGVATCVSGGENADSIPYSNITLQFQTGSPAIKHFGAQPMDADQCAMLIQSLPIQG